MHLLAAAGGVPVSGAIVKAGALIFLGYAGFELIANAPEAGRNPGPALPPACLIAIAAFRPGRAGRLRGRWGLLPHAFTESGYELAAARPFPGPAGFTLIAAAAVVSISSPINAAVRGPAQFTCLMGRDGDLAARFGQPA